MATNPRQLFVMDPLEGIDPFHDTTFVIMNEVQRRGRSVWTCRSTDLQLSASDLRVDARRVRVLGRSEERYFQDRGRRSCSLNRFELVWMREDPPFDQQYLYATYLLEHAPVPVVNDPRGLRDSNEKLFILSFPRRIPPTWVGARPARAREFLDSVGGQGVGKTLEGFGGERVFRLSLDDPNLSALLEELTEGGSRTIMVQEYLPAVEEEGDRRLIVLGGEPIGGLTRTPAEGDFRCNLHSGGVATGVGVSDAEEAICRELKDEFLRRGLHLVGLDLIDDRITEINVTSPTCVQEINELADVKLEAQIVDYVEELHLS